MDDTHIKDIIGHCSQSYKCGEFDCTGAEDHFLTDGCSEEARCPLVDALVMCKPIKAMKDAMDILDVENLEIKKEN